MSVNRDCGVAFHFPTAMCFDIHGLGPGILLYRTDTKTLEEIHEGNRIPSVSLLRRPVNDVSLDDFACAPEEHAHAKECSELSSVLEYIKNTGLDAIAHRALGTASRRAQALRTTRFDGSHAQTASSEGAHH